MVFAFLWKCCLSCKNISRAGGEGMLRLRLFVLSRSGQIVLRAGGPQRDIRLPVTRQGFSSLLLLTSTIMKNKD